MVGLIGLIKKIYDVSQNGIDMSRVVPNAARPTTNFNVFAKAPEFQDKFRDTLNKVKPWATAASIGTSFIPGVGPAISMAIDGGMAAASAGDKIWQLNQSRDWRANPDKPYTSLGEWMDDWNVFDVEGLLDNPAKMNALSNVASGNYNGDPAPRNMSHGNYEGNFHY